MWLFSRLLWLWGFNILLTHLKPWHFPIAFAIIVVPWKPREIIEQWLYTFIFKRMGCHILGSMCELVKFLFFVFCFYLRSYENLELKGFDSKSIYILFLLCFFSTDLESGLVRIKDISDDFPNCWSQQARQNYISWEDWLFFALPYLIMAGNIKSTVFLSLSWHLLPFSVLASPQNVKADLLSTLHNKPPGKGAVLKLREEIVSWFSFFFLNWFAYGCMVVFWPASI